MEYGHSCHYCEMDVMELIMQQSALANELRTLYHDLRGVCGSLVAYVST